MPAYTHKVKLSAGAWAAAAMLPPDANHGTVELFLTNSNTTNVNVTLAISSASAPTNDDRVFIDLPVEPNKTVRTDLFVLKNGERVFLLTSASGILVRTQGYYEAVVMGT